MSTVVTKEANFAIDLSSLLADRLMLMMISRLIDDIKHARLYSHRLDVRKIMMMLIVIIIIIIGRSFVTHPHEWWSWSIAQHMRFHITLVQTSRALIIYHQSFCVCRNNNILTSRKQSGSGRMIYRRTMAMMMMRNMTYLDKRESKQAKRTKEM